MIFSRFFSFFLQVFFSKLQVILDFFTGYFHYLYSSFSLLLEVVFNITGCFQNHRQNSLFLQVVFNFTGFFSFFSKVFRKFSTSFFNNFTVYVHFFYKLLSILPIVCKITWLFLFFYSFFFNFLTGYFHYCYRFFSLILVIFIKFTGHFQNFYR